MAGTALTLSPETERMIAEQVGSGRFPTPEAGVVAAVAGLAGSPAPRVDGEEGAWDESLYAEDLAAIAEADAEAERGDGIDLETFRAEVAKWFVEPR